MDSNNYSQSQPHYTQQQQVQQYEQQQVQQQGQAQQRLTIQVQETRHLPLQHSTVPEQTPTHHKPIVTISPAYIENLLRENYTLLSQCLTQPNNPTYSSKVQKSLIMLASLSEIRQTNPNPDCS